MKSLKMNLLLLRHIAEGLIRHFFTLLVYIIISNQNDDDNMIGLSRNITLFSKSDDLTFLNYAQYTVNGLHYANLHC